MTIPQAFVSSLDRLAAPATDQIRYLTSLGVSGLADELALEFDDLYRPIVAELEQLSLEAAALCRELDRLLSSERLGWTFADLESTQWELIRTTAAAASAGLRRSAGGSR